MGKLIEEMTNAGVLLATEGCQASAKGARVRLADGKFSVTEAHSPKPRNSLRGSRSSRWIPRTRPSGGANVSWKLPGTGRTRSGCSTRRRIWRAVHARDASAGGSQARADGWEQVDQEVTSYKFKTGLLFELGTCNYFGSTVSQQPRPAPCRQSCAVTASRSGPSPDCVHAHQ